MHDRIDGDLVAGERAVEHLALVQLAGVVDVHVEQEAIELCLGQGIGAFLLDGVLGGQDEKGRGQGEGLAADRDLALLHRLEQRRLHFGRGAVDLVGEQDVGEDGTLANFES